MEKNFKTYDYTSVTVKPSDRVRTVDLYESFGWEIADEQPSQVGTVTLTLRRDRKIPHKSELNRLERKALSLKESVDSYTASKTRGASIFAYSFGCVAALIFGGGMCMTMLLEGGAGLAGGIILGVIGIVLCAINYPVYKQLVVKNSKKVQPALEDSEEKLATICEQGHSLVVNPEI